MPKIMITSYKYMIITTKQAQNSPNPKNLQKKQNTKCYTSNTEEPHKSYIIPYTTWKNPKTKNIKRKNKLYKNPVAKSSTFDDFLSRFSFWTRTTDDHESFHFEFNLPGSKGSFYPALHAHKQKQHQWVL